MKILSQTEAVLKKDLLELWSVKAVRYTLLALPLFFAVLFPVAYLGMTYIAPYEEISGISRLFAVIPDSVGYTMRQGLFYLAVNMVCPMFFLMIPLISSLAAASCCFVGEKERGTQDSLLLSPMETVAIFKAKAFCGISLSAISTAVSLAALVIVVGVGNALLEMPFFFNWDWLVLVLVLTPAVMVFGVVYMALVSGGSKNFLESLQASGYVILPGILITLCQFAGLFTLNAVVLLLIGGLLAVTDVILWVVAVRRCRNHQLLR